jgi:hypothetical protein
MRHAIAPRHFLSPCLDHIANCHELKPLASIRLVKLR